MKRHRKESRAADTRRGFLEQFGLVGGSALVMSAMRSWELMAAQAGPRPVLSGTAERDEGRDPRRGRVRDDRRLRAGQARIQRPHSRSARSRRRRELDAAARRDAHRSRPGRRNAGLQFRRGSLSQRRTVAPAALAHRRARLLQGARRAAGDLHQRERVVVLLLRGRNHRTAGQQARPAARGQGRHDRLHLRADGEGRQPGHARSCR